MDGVPRDARDVRGARAATDSSSSTSARRGRWSRGGKYFYTRNASAVVAFAVGGGYEPGDGFVIVGAHTDSPCPKLKPNTRVEGGDEVRVRVQPYGGGLWHTWFDRDLGIAGRVVVKSSHTGEILHRLVRIDRAVCRIPTLAIHLDRNVNSEGMKVNFQQHMAPILATRAKAEAKDDDEGGEKTTASDGKGVERTASPAAADVARRGTRVRAGRHRRFRSTAVRHATERDRWGAE